MWKIALGVTGTVLGAFLGVVIGIPVTDMLYHYPPPDSENLHRLLAFLIGAPIGGLVGCVLGVISGGRLRGKNPRHVRGLRLLGLMIFAGCVVAAAFLILLSWIK
jgi:hypothetical protein